MPSSNPISQAPAAAPVSTPAAPVKRGRGRPRKNPLPETQPTAAPVKRGPGRPRKNPLPEQTVEPKKRGRPRKDAVAATAPVKRGPGRPRKDASAPAKRGPGRPPKNSTTKKRGPGRPPKVDTVKRGPGRPRKNPEAPVKRGPGRPPKNPDAVAPVKRGRGRPRKNPETPKPAVIEEAKQELVAPLMSETPISTPSEGAVETTAPASTTPASSSPVVADPTPVRSDHGSIGSEDLAINVQLRFEEGGVEVEGSVDNQFKFTISRSLTGLVASEEFGKIESDVARDAILGFCREVLQ